MDSSNQTCSAFSSNPLLNDETAKLHELADVVQLITLALLDEPPARISDGNVFRDGYHVELDELRKC